MAKVKSFLYFQVVRLFNFTLLFLQLLQLLSAPLDQVLRADFYMSSCDSIYIVWQKVERRNWNMSRSR